MIDDGYILTCVNCGKKEHKELKYPGQSKLRYCDKCFEIIFYTKTPTGTTLKEKYDKMRESGRNFNEEFMVNLWSEYNQKCTCDQCKPKKKLYWDKVPYVY